MHYRGRSEPACRQAGGAGSWRGVVAARGGLWVACPREERTRGRTGGAGGVSRVHLASDSPWTRSTGSYGRTAAEQRGGDGAGTCL